MQTVVIIPTDELKDLVDSAVNSGVKKALAEVASTAAPSQEQPEDEILNGVQICERFGISEPTLRRYREAGKIPFLTIGGTYRYRFSEVLAAVSNLKKSKA